MSIANRLYFVLGIMAVLIAVELGALYVTIHALSAVRAYVGGEGLWSKAEKDAAYHLAAYGRTHDQREYDAYQTFLRVSQGDHQARLEMAKSDPDSNTEYQGFLQGRNHPDDIAGMIALFARFHQVSYIAQAIGVWTEGDALMGQLESIGTKLHDQVRANAPQTAIDQTLNDLSALNDKLTAVEDRFSFTLGEGSRWLTDIVLKVLLGIALTVELTGIVLTVSITRGVSTRLNDVLRAADRVSKGDYRLSLDERSKDEIGRLAAAFNKMTRDVERERNRAEEAARQSETSLREAQRVAHIGSWEWDLLTDKLSWSKELYRIHGIAPDGFEPKYSGLLGRVYSEDRGRIEQALRTAFESQEPLALDYRITLPSGEVRWLYVEGTIVRDETGKAMRMVGMSLDITDRKFAEERLEYLAHHDPLTGLPNRTLLVDRLAQAIGAAKRTEKRGALLFLDLDHFKNVNDTLGHALGDRLLILVGERLKEVVRRGDTVARSGGDEFLVVLAELPADGGTGAISRIVMGSFAQPFPIGEHALYVTASTGISVFPADGDDVETIIRNADTAMYQAKTRGRNNFQFYNADMRVQAVPRLDIASESRLAPDDGGVVPPAH